MLISQNWPRVCIIFKNVSIFSIKILHTLIYIHLIKTLKKTGNTSSISYPRSTFCLVLEKCPCKQRTVGGLVFSGNSFSLTFILILLIVMIMNTTMKPTAAVSSMLHILTPKRVLMTVYAIETCKT